MGGCSVILLSGIFAIITVAFLAVMFIAIFTFILALTLLIIGIVKKKKGKKSGKVLIIISIIIFTIWFVIVGLIVGWNIYSNNRMMNGFESTNKIESSEEILNNNDIENLN